MTMAPLFRILFLILGGAALAIALFVSISSLTLSPQVATIAPNTQIAAVPASQETPTTTPATSTPKASAATSAPATHPATTTKKPAPNQQPASSNTTNTAQQSHNTDPNRVVRVQDPYPYPPETSAQVNLSARAALVNILCTPRSGGTLRPISGSGVVIDPRGVILTNAHVAQYVLLSQDPRVDLSCFVRGGSPARAHWVPTVVYLPPVWITEHANELNTEHPTGTGEHDYALLLASMTTDGTAPTLPFSYLPFDAREGIAFQDDQVLAASYPAEFLGGLAAQNDLYPASSVTTIGQLLTFNSGTIDILSLGGIIEAQSGSSGGAVANSWGKLVGIITTTSEGTTTASRDLRAVTLSYINRDIAAQSGKSLEQILQGDVFAEASDFNATEETPLANLLIAQITK